jgi:hypothetical protein
MKVVQSLQLCSPSQNKDDLCNLKLGRPRRRWVDNIKMDLREIEWDGVDWVDMAQDRDQWRALVNMVLNLRVP